MPTVAVFPLVKLVQMHPELSSMERKTRLSLGEERLLKTTKNILVINSPVCGLSTRPQNRLNIMKCIKNLTMRNWEGSIYVYEVIHICFLKAQKTHWWKQQTHFCGMKIKNLQPSIFCQPQLIPCQICRPSQNNKVWGYNITTNMDEILNKRPNKGE